MVLVGERTGILHIWNAQRRIAVGGRLIRSPVPGETAVMLPGLESMLCRRRLSLEVWRHLTPGLNPCRTGCWRRTLGRRPTT